MIGKPAFFRDTRVDVSSSTRRYTDEGYLIVEALIARTGIQEYAGYELPDKTLDSNKIYRIYRPESEVFSEKTLNSFKQKPVTNEHPYDEGGWLTADTATKKLVGVSGTDVSRINDKIKIPLTIFSADTIADIENGKVGLSAGYKCDVIMAPGKTKNGEIYDGIQKNIDGNHIAICDVNEARGGAGCRIMDKKTTRVIDMRNADGDEQKKYPDLSDMNQLGQMILEMGQAIKEGFSNIITTLQQNNTADADDENDTPEPEDVDSQEITDEDDIDDNDTSQTETQNDPRNPISGKATDKRFSKNGGKILKKRMADTRNLEMTKLIKEIDYLKGQLAVAKKSMVNDKRVDQIVSARVKLINEAQQVLQGQDLTQLNAMDSLAIKKAVIKQVMPDITLDSSPAFIDGVYQSCVNVFLRGSNSADRLAGAIMDSYSNNEHLSDDLAVLDSGQMTDSARQKMVERKRNAWKKSEGK